MARLGQVGSECLSGWGRYPVLPCVTHAPANAEDLAQAIGTGPVIARGAGRAYGDSALQPQGVISMQSLGKTLSLDADTGVLEADAGASFTDVLARSVPQGWFVPVTPGTRFVTLGGAAAADVHGKNHHVDGGFGDHLLWLEVMDHRGETRRCSRTENAALFEATIGGMGLTGIIRRLALKMRPVETAWMRQETVLAPTLEAAVEAFEASSGWTYSVAWIDAMARGRDLGRSVLYRGEHARLGDIPPAAGATPLTPPPRRGALRVPVDAPGFLLNRLSARAFNLAYWQASRRKAGVQVVDYETYFYPLDGILQWNRLYGRRGFVQYQCVFPLESSLPGMRAMLEAVHATGLGAFLAVLKLMGPQSRGGLSFPMEGYTLALDFPVTRALPALLARLDDIVTAHGGRLYLAKDARMDAETFRRGYGDLDSFENLRRRIGAAGVFKSHQSERLGLS
jgi:FAD/FMN-containing dehydrogenase